MSQKKPIYYERLFDPSTPHQIWDKALQRLEEQRKSLGISHDDTFVADARCIHDGQLDSLFECEVKNPFSLITLEDIREVLLSQISGVNRNSMQVQRKRCFEHLQWLRKQADDTAITTLDLGVWDVQHVKATGDYCGSLWESSTGYDFELTGDVQSHVLTDPWLLESVETAIGDGVNDAWEGVASIEVSVMCKTATKRARSAWGQHIRCAWPATSEVLRTAFSEESRLKTPDDSRLHGEMQTFSRFYLAPSPRLDHLLSDEGRMLCDICLTSFADGKEREVDLRIINAVKLIDQGLKQTNDAIGLALTMAAAEAILCDRGKNSISEQLSSRAATLLESKPAKRRAAIQAIKSLYNKRSKALHGELLEQPRIYCLKALRLVAGLLRAYCQWRCFQLKMADQTRAEFLGEVTGAYEQGKTVVGVSETLSGLLPS